MEGGLIRLVTQNSGEVSKYTKNKYVSEYRKINVNSGANELPRNSDGYKLMYLDVKQNDDIDRLKSIKIRSNTHLGQYYMYIADIEKLKNLNPDIVVKTQTGYRYNLNCDWVTKNVKKVAVSKKVDINLDTCYIPYGVYGNNINIDIHDVPDGNMTLYYKIVFYENDKRKMHYDNTFPQCSIDTNVIFQQYTHETKDIIIYERSCGNKINLNLNMNCISTYPSHIIMKQPDDEIRLKSVNIYSNGTTLIHIPTILMKELFEDYATYNNGIMIYNLHYEDLYHSLADHVNVELVYYDDKDITSVKIIQFAHIFIAKQYEHFHKIPSYFPIKTDEHTTKIDLQIGLPVNGFFLSGDIKKIESMELIINNIINFSYDKTEIELCTKRINDKTIYLPLNDNDMFVNGYDGALMCQSFNNITLRIMCEKDNNFMFGCFEQNILRHDRGMFGLAFLGSMTQIDPTIIKELLYYLELSSEDICPISRTKFEKGDKFKICDTCHQKYNLEMIDKWLENNNSCPYCRQGWTNSKVYINEKADT